MAWRGVEPDLVSWELWVTSLPASYSGLQLRVSYSASLKFFEPLIDEWIILQLLPVILWWKCSACSNVFFLVLFHLKDCILEDLDFPIFLFIEAGEPLHSLQVVVQVPSV